MSDEVCPWQIAYREVTLPGAVYVGALFLFLLCDGLLSDEGVGRKNVLRGVRAPGACKFLSCICLAASCISLAGSYILC